MNNSAKVDYIANGVTTVFSFPFWVMLEEDITVVIDDIIQVTGFTVNGILDPSGGNVEFDTPPANGAVITLLLTPVPIRLVTYQQNGDLAPITLNNDFDRLYLLALSNKNTVTQALSLGLSDIDGQGSFRARNNRITGLGAPIDNSDAVRKVDVVDLVKPFDDNARASADAAALSASASGASSADSALFAGKSEASAVRSEASDVRSEASAVRSEAAAVRAKESADSIYVSVIESKIETLSQHVIHAYSTVPTEKQADLIYVYPFGVMIWVPEWSLYRSIECGHKRDGWSFYGAVDGYVEANGSYYSKSGNYKGLWSAVNDLGLVRMPLEWAKGKYIFSDENTDTFRVPDIRGYGSRNASLGSTVDAGRVVFSAQEDAMQRIYGEIGRATYQITGAGSGAFERLPDPKANYNTGNIPGAVNSGFSFDSSRVARTADETRHKNTAYPAWIKI